MNPSYRTPLLILAGVILGFCANAALNALRSPSDASGGDSSLHASANTSARPSSQNAAPGAGSVRKTQVSAEAFERGRQAVTNHPDDLKDKIAGITSAGERLEYIRGVFSALAHDYPEYALELAGELTEPREKSTAMRALALEWAFDESIDTGEGLTNAIFGAALALSATNPQKATLLASSELEGRERNFALMATASRWAEMDPQGAVEWASELPQDQREGFVMVRVATTAADQDPSLAASLVSKLDDGRSRSWAVSEIASKWFQQDPNGAVAWTSSLTEPGDQSRAIGSIASQWAQNDPVAAVEWAAQIESPELQRSASTAALRQWAEKDPAAAAAYANDLPAGELKTAGVESVASGWARTDRDAARTWAQSLPDQQLRDAATRATDRRGRGPGPR